MDVYFFVGYIYIYIYINYFEKNCLKNCYSAQYYGRAKQITSTDLFQRHYLKFHEPVLRYNHSGALEIVRVYRIPLQISHRQPWQQDHGNKLMNMGAIEIIIKA